MFLRKPVRKLRAIRIISEGLAHIYRLLEPADQPPSQPMGRGMKARSSLSPVARRCLATQSLELLSLFFDISPKKVLLQPPRLEPIEVAPPRQREEEQEEEEEEEVDLIEPSEPAMEPIVPAAHEEESSFPNMSYEQFSGTEDDEEWWLGYLRGDEEEDHDDSYDHLDDPIFDEAEKWDHKLFVEKKSPADVLNFHAEEVRYRGQTYAYVPAYKDSRMRERFSRIMDNRLAEKYKIDRRLSMQGISRGVAPVVSYCAPPPAREPVRTRTYHPPPQQSENEEERQLRLAIQASLRENSQAYGGLSLHQLMDLQSRELTPNDYELLLMLDNTIKPKTVSQAKLQSLPVAKIEDELYTELICTVCQMNYELGEEIKTLPCGHFFHVACIDQWLSESSTKCPQDGLPIES